MKVNEEHAICIGPIFEGAQETLRQFSGGRNAFGSEIFFHLLRVHPNCFKYPLLGEFLVKNIINLKLDNKAQEHEITDIKVDLMGFLRHRLNNYEVDLKTFIEKGTEEKGLYTSADKFKKMAQKNPALEELKKKIVLFKIRL